LQLQKQERSNDGEEEKEEDGHTEEARAAFMSLPLLASSSSSSSSFLFSGNRAIGNSSILRQANEELQKQLQQQLQEKDSSILRFHPKVRRERERERAAAVQFLRISSIKLLKPSSNKLSRKQACFHICLFICWLLLLQLAIVQD
jgi:hypothetical protein